MGQEELVSSNNKVRVLAKHVDFVAQLIIFKVAKQSDGASLSRKMAALKTALNVGLIRLLFFLNLLRSFHLRRVTQIYR